MEVSFRNLKDRQFTKRQEQLVRLLCIDSLFIGLVERARTVCSIPPGGLREPHKLSAKYRRLVASFASLLLDLYELDPVSWLATILRIIVYNGAIPSISPISLQRKTGELQILVRENLPLSQIKIFIDRHKSELVNLLNGLPKPKGTKITNLNQKKLMLELRQQGKSTVEISEELSDIETPFVSSYDLVGAELNRFVDKLASLSKKGNEKLRRKALDEIISGKRKLI